MGRYRRVDVRIWSDAKFRRLSDDGKMLWLHLLTTPLSTSIPGVVVAGPAALAEALEWLPERFAEPFAELLADGFIRADERARLVWLPKALRRNPPANPNTVRSWAKQWDEVPECPLKHDIWRALKPFAERFAKQLGEPFAKLFEEPFAEQEQKQKQKQKERESTPAPRDSKRKPPNTTSEPAARALALVAAEELRDRTGRRTDANGKGILKLCRRLAREGHTPEQVRDVVRVKVDEWQGDPKMERRLTPSTLLAFDNFTKYLEEDVPNPPKPAAMGKTIPFDPAAKRIR